MISKYLSFESNPLCGIGTYKDTLNLATGACTRRIYKWVFTGQEAWNTRSDTPESRFFWIMTPSAIMGQDLCISSHFSLASIGISNTAKGFQILSSGQARFRPEGVEDIDGTAWKAWLAAQYAAGTPVTVWYVLATPEETTIPVPSGLTGTIEGYLNQDGTPTPTNPIYPTANTGSFVEIPYKRYENSTDTITTLPAEIIADGNSATVGLQGNMSQSGTPTPSNPIQPSECGVRTENLFDKDNASTLNAYPSGGVIATVNTGKSIYIPCKPNTTYTVVKMVTARFAVYLTDTTPNIGTEYTTVQYNNEGTKITITTGANTQYLCAFIYNSSIDTMTFDEVLATVMIVEGSTTPTSYIPYGYKIPIFNGQTTNVYLGETQSTRNIKQLVLTGNETFTTTEIEENVKYRHRVGFTKADIDSRTATISSHFLYTINWTSYGINITNDGIWLYLIVEQNQDDFKAWLAAQYAAGTPATIWYVLATPETGAVNEPLRKIGDYADSIAGLTIPTTGTAEQFDIDTPIKPSEVSLTYTGWHNKSDHKF